MRSYFQYGGHRIVCLESEVLESSIQIRSSVPCSHLGVEAARDVMLVFGPKASVLLVPRRMCEVRRAK